jgi:predicted transcriptional regulator
VETCLEIKVERLLSSILTFTPKVNSLLAPDAQGVTWVFDFARASAFLVASTKESRVYFKRELLDGWKPHHSFWRVRSMSAIIP